MITLLLAGLSFAQECQALSPLGRERLSVAWVSPAGRQVWHHTSLEVVPTTELQAWLKEHGPTVPRMLQGLGLRRSHKQPVRRWKVTIFEVDADTLCRPLAGYEAGEIVAGHPVCKREDRGVRGDLEGCGVTLDAHAQQAAMSMFTIKWRDAAAAGFCVLPADRFVRGS